MLRHNNVVVHHVVIRLNKSCMACRLNMVFYLVADNSYNKSCRICRLSVVCTVGMYGLLVALIYVYVKFVVSYIILFVIRER